ncbi:MAG TPA: CBS domain-containing protein [Acetobacteraceae bacterium]|nr:CBS domain-containing protein [Acetobacteraceae bacterium]
MLTVAAILKRKAFQAVVVAPTDRIETVARALAERHAEAALVLDRAQQLLGVISERDIIEGIAANGARTLEMTAGQLMRWPIRSVTPRTAVADALRIMLAGRLHNLPVFDEQGLLVGIVGLEDAVRASIARDEGALAA